MSMILYLGVITTRKTRRNTMKKWPRAKFFMALATKIDFHPLTSKDNP